MQTYRDFLKDHIRQTVDFSQTDQNREIAPPPLEKPFDPHRQRIDLIAKKDWQNIPRRDVSAAIEQRASRRNFTAAPLTFEELSFLLWATQGIRQAINRGTALRTVPSAGCRHALETYLCVFNVAQVEPGFYRYLPVEHQLLFEFQEAQAAAKLSAAALDQTFVGRGAVTFIWTTIPYRMEWRYSLAAYKVIALDAGHVCQNLYLACEVIGAGTCAIAAYDQDRMDRLMRLDGKEEFVIYLAPVGKI